MRKILFFSIIALIYATVSMAAVFQPTVMEISVQDMVPYNFDGSDVEIPVNIAGQGGSFWLVITTKDQGPSIGRVQNGFLGWHTVNNIDTTVYVSPPYPRQTGDTSITWNGMSDTRNGSGQVAPGTYNYYVYGFDDQSTRQIASAYIKGSPPWDGTYVYPIENDENGNPLANPMFVGTLVWYQCPQEVVEPFRTGNHFKWTLGTDPYDRNGLQTTHCGIYNERSNLAYGAENQLINGPAVFNPQDFNIFYHCCLKPYNKIATMFKWAFIPDGEAVMDETFLGWEEVTWDEKDVLLDIWSCPAGCYTDGNNIFINATNTEGTFTDAEWNVIRIVSFDGEILVNEAQIPDYFMPDDVGAQGKINCQIRDIWARAQNEIIMLPTGCCLHEMIDASPLYEHDDPTLIWSNGNGDFFMDIQWRADDESPWACLHNAEYEEQRTNSVCVDKHYFTTIDVEYGGLVSFGVECPDGFSIAMLRYKDETVENAHHKTGTTIIDYGSNFDGYYTGAKPGVMEDESNWESYDKPELNFVATDTAGGVISSEVAVDEDDQVAFVVDQNSPNPFNPTTTIGFTIPEDANVTVEVFNVAGQKVETLVNGHMNAGQHNVVWDASGFSNGVYFYTVKAGEFAKTMKMTLLK